MRPALAALAAAWLAFCLLVFAYGEAPWAMGAELARGTWGTWYGVGQVLFKATPLLFTGVAVDLALRAGLFNIGAEGQLAVGSLACGVVGARLPAGTPSFVAIPAALAAAALAGAAWAAVPALLKARAGAHEVISTIMMNRVADGFVGFAFASGGVALAGTVRTPDVVSGARVPRLAAVLPGLSGSAASFAVVAGVAAALLAAASYTRTRAGREIVLVGLGPRACAAEGIAVGARMTQALVVSGAIAGAASLGTVLGYKGYDEQGLGGGAGFGGIAVALLAQKSALGLVLAALLFGTLQQGGLALNAFVPKELMDVLEGVVIVAVALAQARRAGAGSGRT